METFHLYHLAKNYVPVKASTQLKVPDQTAPSPPRIRAAAAQMIFASRLSKAFITPDQVLELETWSGRAILEALIGIDLPADVRVSPASLVHHQLTG